MKNKKSKSKIKTMTLTMTILGLLGIGGAATGVAILVVNNMQNQKTNIKSVFEKLDATWKTDVSIDATPEMTNDNCLGGNKFSGEGLREGSKNVVWDANSLLYYLQQQINENPDITTDHSIVNELTVSFQEGYNTTQAYNKWQKVTLAAMSHSVNYTGSIDFYYYLDKTDQIRNLENDFTETDINMKTDYSGTYAPTNNQILNAMKSANQNLDINSVHIQYCFDTTLISPTWIDWAQFDQDTGTWKTSETAGVNSEQESTSSVWLSLWNTNGYYGRKSEESSLKYALRLIPNPNYSVYSQEPEGIQFTITFDRPNVYDDAKWQTNNDWSYDNSHQYIVDPDIGNFKTTFVQYYGDTTEYSFFNKLNSFPDSWYFKKTVGDNKYYAQIAMDESNPYYSNISENPDISIKNKLLFQYNLLTQINFKNTYESIVTGGIKFYTNPSRADIINYFQYQIDTHPETFSPVFWQEVGITIDTTNKTITLSVDKSLHYTGDDLVFSYTLIQ